MPPLTRRERDVLALVVAGKSSSAIAAELCVGTKTVETYRWRIYTKLGVHSLPALLAYAIVERMVPPSSMLGQALIIRFGGT